MSSFVTTGKPWLNPDSIVWLCWQSKCPKSWNLEAVRNLHSISWITWGHTIRFLKKDKMCLMNYLCYFKKILKDQVKKSSALINWWNSSKSSYILQGALAYSALSHSNGYSSFTPSWRLQQTHLTHALLTKHRNLCKVQLLTSLGMPSDEHSLMNDWYETIVGKRRDLTLKLHIPQECV